MSITTRVAGSSARISRQASIPEPSGQPDVHHDDVRLEAAGLLDGLGDGAGLGDDLEPVAAVEQRDEALADDLVVVDDEQAQRTGRVISHGWVLRSPRRDERRMPLLRAGWRAPGR